MTEEEILKLRKRYKEAADVAYGMGINPEKEYELKFREDIYTKGVMFTDNLEEPEARVIAREIVQMEEDEKEQVADLEVIMYCDGLEGRDQEEKIKVEFYLI